MGDQTYDNDEIEAILARAATLGGGQSDQGLSLKQLQEVGAEAGIDPQAVARAAREIEREKALMVRPEPGVAKVRGSTLSLERFVPGVESPDDLPRALSVIQEQMGEVGQVSLQQDLLVWGASRQRQLTITIRPGPGGATLRAKESLQDLKGAAYGGWLGGLGGGLGGGLAWLFGMMFGFVGVAFWLVFCMMLGFVLAKITIHRGIEKRQAQLEDLSESLTRHMLTHQPPESGAW